MTYSHNIAYNSSGLITQIRFEEAKILDERLSRGERVIEVPEPIDILRYKVVDGAVVDKSPEELAELPSEPDVIPNMAEIYDQQHS